MPLTLSTLSVGEVELNQTLFLPQAPKGVRMRAPALVWLLRHPRGNVLVDTGIDPEAFANPQLWGGLAKAMTPMGLPQDALLPQLQARGLSPDDISIVVNTHLHMDHAGGNRFFPRATFFVHRLEMETAKDPRNEGNGYFRTDWDHPLDYRLVDGEADLFGDGRVWLKHLPGHTPGFMVVVVELDGGRAVLAGDACPLEEVLRTGLVPKNMLDPEKVKLGWEWLREQQRQGAYIVFGHDPAQRADMERRFPAQA